MICESMLCQSDGWPSSPSVRCTQYTVLELELLDDMLLTLRTDCQAQVQLTILLVSRGTVTTMARLHADEGTAESLCYGWPRFLYSSRGTSLRACLEYSLGDSQ